jgi:hypothetical protein
MDISDTMLSSRMRDALKTPLISVDPSLAHTLSQKVKKHSFDVSELRGRLDRSRVFLAPFRSNSFLIVTELQTIPNDMDFATDKLPTLVIHLDKNGPEAHVPMYVTTIASVTDNGVMFQKMHEATHMSTMNATMAISFGKLRSDLQNIENALLKDDLDSNVVESIAATFCDVRDELKSFLLKQHATYDLSVQHEKLWMFDCTRDTDVRSQEFNELYAELKTLCEMFFRQ